MLQAAQSASNAASSSNAAAAAHVMPNAPILSSSGCIVASGCNLRPDLADWRLDGRRFLRRSCSMADGFCADLARWQTVPAQILGSCGCVVTTASCSRQ